MYSYQNGAHFIEPNNETQQDYNISDLYNSNPTYVKSNNFDSPDYPKKTSTFGNRDKPLIVLNVVSPISQSSNDLGIVPLSEVELKNDFSKENSDEEGIYHEQ